MTITKSIENNILTLKLEGWLDTTTSEDLGKEIEKCDNVSSIILDFEKLEYISSAGLRQVVAFSKKAKSIDADFSIINAGLEVMSVFQLTQLDKKFKIGTK